jgi:predicted transposase YbfD/YdcC
MEFTLPRTRQHLREHGVAVFDLKGLFERLGRLEDRRGERGRRYALAPLLMLVVLAKLAGEDTPVGIADWVGERAEELGPALHLPWPRMPHHNTFRRILAFVVEPAALDHLVSQHLLSLPGVGHSRLIGFDGKTVRGTIGEASPQGEHLLAACLVQEDLVVGQVAVGAKENEITQAPVLLGQLELRGKVVMGDAMHTQVTLSEQIVAAEGEFVWLVKDNQPTLREEIATLFEPPTPTVLGNVLPDDFATYERREAGHGRRERRKLTVSSELHGYSDWPHLEQVFRLERERIDPTSGAATTEVVYGLTSLSRAAASAKDLFRLVRAYWGIENGLHQRRDVTFREDRTRQTLGRAGHVMASLNNLVIGLLRVAGFTNLAHARRVCAGMFNRSTYLAIARTLT